MDDRQWEHRVAMRLYWSAWCVVITADQPQLKSWIFAPPTLSVSSCLQGMQHKQGHTPLIHLSSVASSTFSQRQVPDLKVWDLRLLETMPRRAASMITHSNALCTLRATLNGLWQQSLILVTETTILNFQKICHPLTLATWYAVKVAFHCNPASMNSLLQRTHKVQARYLTVIMALQQQEFLLMRQTVLGECRYKNRVFQLLSPMLQVLSLLQKVKL